MIPTGEARAIRTVAVVGSGIVAYSAAIAFARALPRSRVALVETPPDPAALADRLSGTLTSVHGFHLMIGLDEDDLVRRGAATHRLGTRFERWSADGEPWLHVHGDYGRDSGGIAFHHVWARARRAGAIGRFDRFSAAAAIADAGRFVHPESDRESPLSTYSYALRLHPDRYFEVLAEAAARLPLLRGRAAVAGVERREDGGVSALQFAGGGRLEADLFIDCGGPSAPVLSRIDDRFEDWSRWMPADRLLIGRRTNPEGPMPLDRAVAGSIGWRGESPIGDESLVTLAYAAESTTEARARRVLASETGIESAEAAAIRPGRRPEPWLRNVLAIGDAAEAVDPLEATNLHLAQSAIMRALGLLPGRDFHAVELGEYNRRTEQQVLRVRDFLTLHYLRSGRRDRAFWKGLAKRAPPDSLGHTLEQFERRGRLPYYENESFDRHGWTAALLGLGVLPKHTDPIADGIAFEQSLEAIKRLERQLEEFAQKLPPYRAYLDQIRRAPRRAASGHR